MKNNFQDCLSRVLEDEGGYSNDPDDAGGPTKYGITITDVRKYVKKNATAQDVRNLSLDEAKSIYKSKYWDTLRCDLLSSGVDYTVFDYGVNSGIGRPRKALQRFKSLSGTKLITAINDERATFLRSIGIGHNAKYLKGWLARVSRVRKHSLDMAKVPQTPKTIAGVFATVLATFSNGYHWVLNHPIEASALGIAFGLLTYTIIHFIHKAIK